MKNRTLSARLGDLAVRFGCDLKGDPETIVTHVATLNNAGEGALSFLANPNYVQYLASSEASCVVLRAEHSDACPGAALIHRDPYRVYAGIAAELYPDEVSTESVHVSAVMDASASVDPSAQIDANVVIGAGCEIGAGVIIGANCSLADNVKIGAATRLFPNVSIYKDVKIGGRCRIQSGAVIGSDGFGFAPGADGWRRVPQVGSVLIGDDVDIGANATIDRGAIDDTRLADGVRVDNLVQIAHNVEIGEHSALAAQTGIAGSTKIGRNCLFAGHSGAVGHINICDGVIVSGKTMVTKTLTEPGAYGAALPAMKISLYRRVMARIRQLDKLTARIAKLEKNTEDRS